LCGVLYIVFWERVRLSSSLSSPHTLRARKVFGIYKWKWEWKGEKNRVHNHSTFRGLFISSINIFFGPESRPLSEALSYFYPLIHSNFHSFIFSALFLFFLPKKKARKISSFWSPSLALNLDENSPSGAVKGKLWSLTDTHIGLS